MASANDRMATRDAIIVELRNQIEELKEERDFYRKQWTRVKGKTYTKPGEQEQPVAPLFEKLTEPTFDAEWTADDRDLFQGWAANCPRHINAEEEWRRLHGSTPPLLVLPV